MARLRPAGESWHPVVLGVARRSLVAALRLVSGFGAEVAASARAVCAAVSRSCLRMAARVCHAASDCWKAWDWAVAASVVMVA